MNTVQSVHFARGFLEFDCEQVAAVLDCSARHVGSLVRSRKLAAFNFAGKLETRAIYHIHPAALQKFLQEAVVA